METRKRRPLCLNHKGLLLRDKNESMLIAQNIVWTTIKCLRTWCDKTNLYLKDKGSLKNEVDSNVHHDGMSRNNSFCIMHG
jgi:hypothetical protein